MTISIIKVTIFISILVILAIMIVSFFVYVKPKYDNSLLQKGFNNGFNVGVYTLSIEQTKSGNFYFITPTNNITFIPVTQLCNNIGVQNES